MAYGRCRDGNGAFVTNFVQVEEFHLNSSVSLWGEAEEFFSFGQSRSVLFARWNPAPKSQQCEEAPAPASHVRLFVSGGRQLNWLFTPLSSTQNPIQHQNAYLIQTTPRGHVSFMPLQKRQSIKDKILMKRKLCSLLELKILVKLWIIQKNNFLPKCTTEFIAYMWIQNSTRIRFMLKIWVMGVKNEKSKLSFYFLYF